MPDCKSFLASVFFLLFLSATSNGQENFGRFIGELKFHAQDPGSFVLLDDYTYEDRDKTPWVAYKGLKTDCASIPIYLVPALGAPCLGDFRYAAIIHDRYCQDKEHAESPEVHRMFYYAMRAGGVSNRPLKNSTADGVVRI
jgi:hypothetical protein